MNTNTTQLKPHPPSQVQRISKEGQDKDADFLALRQLNKKARVRLSADPVNLDAIPSRGILFATANSLGCFAAVVCKATGEYALIVSNLADLRAAFASSSSEEQLPFTPQRTIPLIAPVAAIAFASGGSRLLIAYVQGAVAVYDTRAILANGTEVNPLFVYQSSAGTAPRELAANPGELADLVAVLYESGGAPDGQVVQLLDAQQLRVVGAWVSGGTSDTTPASISWSPKGKQLAIGLHNGDIITFSPSDTATLKSSVPTPPSLQGQSLIGMTWLSNQDFHCIYAPAGLLTPESEQTHVVLSLDAKSNTVTDVKLNSPYFPVPALRPPGAFTTVCRQWDPAKFLLFIGDTTSSDIGLLGCMDDASGEVWCNMSLEETSTPNLPLDKDMKDTILVGLALDLTATEKYDFTTVSGEVVSIPPPPIMYAYVNDGTILGWHVINVAGKPYPGMTAAASAMDSTNVSMDTVTDSEEKAVVPAAAVSSAFAEPAEAKSFFSQPSALGSGAQPGPAFGQGSFGQPSALGPTPSSTFGQSSSLGVTSAFGNKGPLSGGFGGFASTGTSKFSQLGFGSSLASLSTPQDGTSLASPMAISMSNSEEPMSADAETDAGMGGLSLGGSSSTDTSKTNNMFGSFVAPSIDTTKPPSAFGTSAFGSGSGSGVLKPATGFGTFASQAPSAFGFGTPTSGESKPSTFGAFGSTPATSATSATEPQPSAFSGAGAATTQASPAFGQSSFGAKTAFGQSSFGQPPFGQSAFGQPAFGATPAKSAFSTSSGTSPGGFAAFASGGTIGFASLAKSAEIEQKPAATTDAGKTSTTGSQPFIKEETTESKPPTPATPAVLANDATSSTADKKPVSAFETSSSTFTGTLATPKAQGETPSTSAFTSSVSAPASGAFAGLTTHPTGFGRLDTGFGAFGGPSISSSSPFLNPKPATASAFGSAAPTFTTPASTPTTPTGSTKPTFGSPSAFGAAAPGSKPAFGTSSPLGSSYSVTTSAFGSSPPPPASAASSVASTPRAFSAFSGSGGFASFASGGTKSFKDLLKSDGSSTGEKGKQRSGDKEQEKQGVEENAKEPAKETTKTEAKSKAQSSIPRWSPAAPVYDTRKTVIPTRTRQSYADYTKERDEEDGETGEAPEGPEDDDSDSFLSESFSDEEEELAAAAKHEEASGLTTLADVATKVGPAIELVSSLPEATTSQEKGKLPLKVDEVSTTPPGSPSKAGTSPPEAPAAVAAPKPVAAPSAPAASLGLGRGKSTKPLRSSPLASAPISGDKGGEEEDLEEVTIIATPKDAETIPETKQPTSTTPAVAPISPALTDSSPEGKPATSRSKTPPLLPSFSTPKPPPFTLTPSTTAAAPGGAKTSSIFSMPLTGSSPFGKPAAEPVSLSSTPAEGSLFGAKPASPPVVPPATEVFGQKPVSPALGGFGSKQPASTSPSLPTSGPQTTSILSTPMSPLPVGGPFGTKPVGSPAQTTNAFSAGFPAPKLPSVPSSALPAGVLFGQPTPQAKLPPAQPASAAAPAPASQAEEGMQRACASLYEIPNKELDQLKALGGQVKKRQADLYRSTGKEKTVDDLADQQKFTVADAAEINRLILGLQQDIAAMKALKATHLKSIAELESSMLRATMRKEEIVRFSKASTDAEFSKMLKMRTLGPDNLETQIQLRRGIRVIADRVQKLEDYIQASKKRLSQVKAGKPGIRPPSLDTVNKSFRNIELAISQLEEDVARLKPRVTKLDLSTTHSPARMLRGKSLTPAMESSGPSSGAVDVTSNVAVTTAAALNAERAAQKLKGALLNVRKEPLLNKQASKAPAPPSAFYAPPKPPKKEWEPPSADVFNSTPAVSGWNLTSPQPSTNATSQWTLPPFQLSDTPPTSSSTSGHATSLRQRNAGGKMHQKPIQLKKSPGAPCTSPAASNFSWGPLPGVSPMATISSDVTKKTANSRPNLPSSLSDSWVADGFGKK